LSFPPQEPTIDYVYVINNKDRNSCKIGRSNNPEGRLRTFKTGNDGNLILTYKLGVDRKNSPKVEALARRIAVKDLGKPKTREWLGRTTPEEAQRCIQQANDIIRGRNRK
jgi:predicted GIY-YIG superfamily endonuclease